MRYQITISTVVLLSNKYMFFPILTLQFRQDTVDGRTPIPNHRLDGAKTL